MAFPKTFADLQQAVVDKGRLDPTQDSQKIKDGLNAAYSQVALESKFFEGAVVGSALVGGAVNQTLPVSLIELEDVTCLAQGIQPRLRQVEWETLLDLRGALVVGAGPPQVYSLRMNSIEFYPAANGGEVLTYFGSKQPDTYLSADGDVPLIPEPFSILLEYGALIHMGEFKADLLMLGDWQQQWNVWMAKFKTFSGVRLGQDSLAFRVLEGRRIYPPNDRSSDFYLNNVGA